MEYKEKINIYLNEFINQKKIIYDIFEGGKRIRPIISYLVFNSFFKKKYSEKKIINLTLFPEILHNISLILDDLPCMDDDNFRRVKKQYTTNMVSIHINFNFSFTRKIFKFNKRGYKFRKNIYR